MEIKPLFVNADFSGCGYYRCMLPARVYREKGLGEARHSIFVGPSHVRYYDLIILQRSCGKGILEIAQKIKENKRPLLYELDDDLFNIPRSNPAYYFYEQDDRKKTAIKILRLCDGAIVSTNYLGEKLKRAGWTKKIFVIPNFLDRNIWGNYPKKSSGTCVLGWAGSSTHYDDLSQIICLLKQMRDKHGVGLKFIGWMPPNVEKAEFSPFKEYEEYTKDLGGISIGVAPLVNNEFNQSKSYVKVLEYNGAGIPCIVSPTENYRRAVDDGAGAVLAKSPKDWIKIMDSLIQREGERMTLVEKGKEWVSKNWIQDNIYLWKDAVEDIMKEYPLAVEVFGEIAPPSLCETKEDYDKRMVEKIGEEISSNKNHTSL